MLRVASTSGSPVALRSRLGPRALTTASAPCTAWSTAPASLSSPVTTVTVSSQLAGILPGLRRYAVTWWPRERSCSTTLEPTPPVAPNTVTFMVLSCCLERMAACVRADGAGRRWGRPAPRGLAGDEDLAEGAVGEGGERLGRALERDGGLDVDADLALGGVVEQGGDLVGGRCGHDGSDGDVVASDFVGAGAAGRRQRAAGLQGAAQRGGIACGVQDL